MPVISVKTWADLKEDKNLLRNFVKEKAINYLIASADDLPSPYGDVRAIPTTFFIDRNGVIQDVFVGYHEYAALKNVALAEDYEGQPKDRPFPVTMNEEVVEADSLEPPRTAILATD